MVFLGVCVWVCMCVCVSKCRCCDLRTVAYDGDGHISIQRIEMGVCVCSDSRFQIANAQ